MASDVTQRFSDRVDNYVKYRPSYPAAVLDYLEKTRGLEPGAAIADIGSGTGIFTGLLLGRGYRVYAVEPNEAMQQAAVEQFKHDKNFVAINGTAEATGLENANISMIVCAQAFHWFDAEKEKTEFARILVPGGQAALIWNNREADTDEFAVAYEALLKQDSVDYNKVNHRNVGDMDFKSFFKNGQYTAVKFPNEQVFDESGLIGRAFSSSYVPKEGTEAGEKFKQMLREVFARHNKHGKVSFHYQTEVYLGRV
jgi:SAM-dependent methyltransferase